MVELTPDLLIRAYRAGIFPMAAGPGLQELVWFDPPWRGVIPLETFYVPRRLMRTYRQNLSNLKINKAFPMVIAACAATREETWISSEIIKAYTGLHEQGHAHSVELWQGDQLVGGLYGVAIGAAFFGESMFSLARDASKLCLVHLVEHMKTCGFTLLDTQFITDHLAQFGAIEIPREDYHAQLAIALNKPARFI